ncbi:MAG: radical SAM protein [Candidatus Pacebacteria bacterium]|nr:radical SAM protein [Candidatus Paceibacterota bacterium]
MNSNFYKIKNGIRWRKEGDSLLLLHPHERRLLIFNKRNFGSISKDGVIKNNGNNLKFINFLKKVDALNCSEEINNSDFNVDSKLISDISAPLNVTIQITNKCNLNCIHCHNNKNKLLKVFPFERFQKLINELNELNVFNINLSGGEPLIVDNVVDFVGYVIDKGMNCTMSTNLTLLNEKLTKELASAGLKKVHISLDSFDPYTHNMIRGVDNSFERMEKNLHSLRDYGIQYTMVTTLIDQSPDHYAKTIDFAYYSGASAHKTNTLVPQGKSLNGLNRKEQYNISEYIKVWRGKRKQYIGKMSILAETMFSIQMNESIANKDRLPEILRIGCPAGILTCGINESGDVIPCSFFTSLILGNVFENKFYDIWHNTLMSNLRRRDKFKVCGECQYCYSCGGCRARAFGKMGSFDSEDPYCFKNNNYEK